MPHVGRRWNATAPKHIFPASFFSGLQVALIRDKAQGQPTVWSHGIHIVIQGQSAMLRLDAEERHFDVVVWGEQPHLLLDELQAAIFDPHCQPLPWARS